MNYDGVISRLQAKSNLKGAAQASRAAITPRSQFLGVPVPEIRTLAKEIKRDHTLALRLWDSGIHEARILATMIADPKLVTPDLMETWAQSFDSWDVCDQCCGNLFDKTPFAYDKALAWTARDEEFVKRAGFALIAYIAVHDKKAPDEKILPFLDPIRREADDQRNFVKKAVNWALRQIGKRNAILNQRAIETAEQIQQSARTPSARWIASDALRELTSDAVQGRLKK
jgi:3-methyladenine DNA glycosylase AlkD